ncbi:MAG: hypothetical protein KAX49_11730 [Halanaerobiales bacterium]|nr:hypothetical protein [Halanaerobiales bacterium]
MLKFNIDVIDELTDGGLSPGETLFLFGDPDSGKSLLAYQLACQYNSLYVNTETGSPAEFNSFLKPRYGKDFHSPIVLNKRSIVSVANMLGLDIKMVTKSKESSIGKMECEIGEASSFPILDYLKKQGSQLLVLDSLTTPIKGAIGSARQNFGARANVISRIMGQLSVILDSLEIAIIVTAHQSQDKTNKYDEGRIWGGESLGYYAKYSLQMTTPHFKIETADKVLYKKVRRRRFLGKLQSKWQNLPLKEDWGYK